MLPSIKFTTGLLSLCSLTIHLFISQALSSNVLTGMSYELAVDPQPGGEQKCQPLNTPFCNINSYSTVQPFNNSLGHTSLSTAIAEMHKFAYLFTREPCKSKIQLFLCSLYAPVCVTQVDLGRLLLPCRDICEEARQVCVKDLAIINNVWPENWDCRKLNYYRDDKLCVINNTIDNGGRSPQLTTMAPIDSPAHKIDETVMDSKDQHPYSSNEFEPPHENETICAEDLFDCRLRNPKRNMIALCIEHNFRCDGKKDCVIDSVDDGLDEVGCDKNCTEGNIYCDGRCLDKSDICNGKVDCSLGTDEQDCYDYPFGLIQSILLIVILLVALYSMIKCFIANPEKKTPEDFHCTNENSYDSGPPHVTNNVTYEASSKPYYHNVITQQRSPIYQELFYTVEANDLYERLNVGGYSGVSSIYNDFCDTSHLPSMAGERIMREQSVMRDPPVEEKEPPAAPPPTPAPPTPAPPIYSTGSSYRMDPCMFISSPSYKIDSPVCPPVLSRQ